MRVVIIDYGSGNLHSALKAFQRAAADGGMTADIRLSSDADTVRTADKVVLPGVGAFADCRNGLAAVDGMIEALHEAAIVAQKPFLGICVGMQLLATRGLEFGETPGLGWIGGEVRMIQPAQPGLKVPHMGWNTLNALRPHALLNGVKTGAEGMHAYFVHSYHLVAENDADLIAETDYAGPVTAIVGRENIAGTQFHPEKSQRLGLQLIENFLRWRI
jgi:glutamine amidotransferase